MDRFGFLILFAIFGVVALVMIVWRFSRSESILREWADRHGYQLVDQQYCWFFKGPFFWTTSRNQTVYYITIEDRGGQVRRGWVRCGGWFLGLMSDHVDVRWED